MLVRFEHRNAITGLTIGFPAILCVRDSLCGSTLCADTEIRHTAAECVVGFVGRGKWVS